MFNKTDHRMFHEMFQPRQHIFVHDRKYVNEAEAFRKTFHYMFHSIFNVSFHME